MSVSILSGNFTVYFDGDTGGDRQIKWTGSAAVTATETLNDLYKAIQDLFDNDDGAGTPAGLYMDYGIPIKAITKREYNFGLVESNDTDPWFIDQTTMEHITGGGIQTTGWTRTPGTNRGIVRVEITQGGSPIVSGDVGNTITSSDTDNDTGTLLYVEDGDYGTALWIRPASSATTNNFDATSVTLTCNGHTATQTTTSTTGENLWINLVTVGSIGASEQIIVSQRITPNNQPTVLTKYWSDGAIDRSFLQTLQGTVFDNGQMYVYQKTETKLYDYYSILTTSGTNVAPISSSDDLNNTTSETTSNGIAVTFSSSATGITADIDQDSTTEYYAVEIDCNGQTLAYTYQYLQYLVSETPGGNFPSTSSFQQKTYVGPELYFEYSSITAGSVTAGDTVTGSTSGARATVIGIDDTNKKVLLQNVRGTFSASENLTTSASATISTLSNITSLLPNKQSPFGSFAGGKFLSARGVTIKNMDSADLNNYQTQDYDGTIYNPPAQVAFSLTGLKDGTEVRIYKTSDSTQIAGVEDMTGGTGTDETSGVTVTGSTDNNTFTYTYIYLSTEAVYVIIMNENYVHIKQNYSLGTTSQSIPITQSFDRNYSNPV